MPRGKATAPKVRARAEALLLAGHTQGEVVTATGLGKATVSAIASTVPDRLEQVRTQKKETDTELLLGYFRSALRAMTSQAELLGDHEYCRTQNAHDLAIAHGVLGDKLAGVAATAQALGILGEPATNRPALEQAGA